MREKIVKHRHVVFLSTAVILVLFFLIFLPKVLSNHYVFEVESSKNSLAATTSKEIVFVPSYIETPASVKGIYMTSWTASASKYRDPLIKLVEDTEINTVVIDIKDYSGRIVFSVDNSKLIKEGSIEVRIPDLGVFIESLHKKGIYVIARLAVFQDAYFVKHRPDLAVKNSSGSAVWKDRKGISWIDPGSREYWDYIVEISREASKVGFDEINFDYIRFPSDGNMQDISYPFSSSTPKATVMRNFFEYLDTNLQDKNLKISADLFGMTTTAQNDMGIGQLIENAYPFFDYIMPMVYPSHYPATFQGFQNPAAHPYEIVNFSMNEAVTRANKMNKVTTTMEIVNGTTTPVKHTEDLNYRSKLRPWLQDFDLGADYGPTEVRAQIKATYDAGLNSWILWSASNKYTVSALLSE